MKLIGLKFLPKYCTIEFPDAIRIRPTVAYTLDVMNTSLDIMYSIEAPNVNIFILSPHSTHLTTGTEGRFAKYITFQKMDQGVKQNFNLVLTVKLGSADEKTVRLPIIYK